MLQRLHRPEIDARGGVAFSIGGLGRFAVIARGDQRQVDLMDLNGLRSITLVRPQERITEQDYVAPPGEDPQAIAAANANRPPPQSDPAGRAILMSMWSKLIRGSIDIVTSPVLLSTVGVFTLIYIGWHFANPSVRRRYRAKHGIGRAYSPRANRDSVKPGTPVDARTAPFRQPRSAAQ
jgi:hypothetical protein